jgi:hypothetical protein
VPREEREQEVAGDAPGAAVVDAHQRQAARDHRPRFHRQEGNVHEADVRGAADHRAVSGPAGVVDRLPTVEHEPALGLAQSASG